MDEKVYAVTGTTDALTHLVVTDEKLRKQAALCGALPRYWSATSTRDPWTETGRVTVHKLCPECVAALAMYMRKLTEVR